ncbi:MAG: VOC family protein [Dactylosporangium sp.]|nr:VOC family protein [Dactylosporangium sp.]
MATVTPGMPCWVDLASPDVEAARRFYGELFGWTSQVAPEPEAAGYTTFRKGDKAVAAVGPLMDQGRQPAWTTYFATGDAEATAARVEGIWGKVVMWPTDVLGYGRMALFRDTTGAPFGVWQPGSMSGEEISGAPGSRTWSELMTRNPEGAKEFYADVLGWRSRGSRYDASNYTIFEIGDTVTAGMMPMDGDGWPADMPPHWAVYFEVEDVDATAATAKRLGGSVSVPPTDSPAGRFAVLADPHGASFSVITSNPEYRP